MALSDRRPDGKGRNFTVNIRMSREAVIGLRLSSSAMRSAKKR